MRKYFQTGELPEPGTICSPEWKPFIGCLKKNGVGKCEELNAEDQVLWDAMKSVAEVWLHYHASEARTDIEASEVSIYCFAYGLFLSVSQEDQLIDIHSSS